MRTFIGSVLQTRCNRDILNMSTVLNQQILFYVRVTFHEFHALPVLLTCFKLYG
jgi:hypothetical protein